MKSVIEAKKTEPARSLGDQLTAVIAVAFELARRHGLGAIATHLLVLAFGAAVAGGSMIAVALFVEAFHRVADTALVIAVFGASVAIGSAVIMSVVAGPLAAYSLATTPAGRVEGEPLLRGFEWAMKFAPKLWVVAFALTAVPTICVVAGDIARPVWLAHMDSDVVLVILIAASFLIDLVFLAGWGVTLIAAIAAGETWRDALAEARTIGSGWLAFAILVAAPVPFVAAVAGALPVFGFQTRPALQVAISFAGALVSIHLFALLAVAARVVARGEDAKLLEGEPA